MRKATVKRNTKETKISLSLDLDGSGKGTIDTGIGFFNHMLELLKKHALIDLTVKADGDLDVDYHHTVEDVGLVFGQALNQALGDRKGITRYGFASIPMDEALCETSIDLGGRPFVVFVSGKKHMMIRDFEVKLLEEFFRAVSVEGRLNIHLTAGRQSGIDHKLHQHRQCHLQQRLEHGKSADQHNTAPVRTQYFPGSAPEWFLFHKL